MDPVSLNSVIIDSNVAKRMQLKQATSSLALFKATQQLTSPEEALSKYEGTQLLDIVFISNRFSEEQIKNFVTTAKQRPVFSDCAFILIVEPKAGEDPGNLSRFLLIGIDGFLLEPYSMDKLIEASKIASKVKKDRAIQRKRAAVEILLNDISTSFNAVASFKAAEMPLAKIEVKFHKMAEQLGTLDLDTLEYFRARLIEVWGNLEAPQATIELPKYKGASTRIKKILEEKVLAQMEKIKTDEPAA